MSSRTVQQNVAELSGPAEFPAGDLETLMRQKMRLHPILHVARNPGLLTRAARAFGRYAGLASHFWQHLDRPAQ